MFTSEGKEHLDGSAFESMPHRPHAIITAGRRYGFTSKDRRPTASKLLRQLSYTLLHLPGGAQSDRSRAREPYDWQLQGINCKHHRYMVVVHIWQPDLRLLPLQETPVHKQFKLKSNLLACGSLSHHVLCDILYFSIPLYVIMSYQFSDIWSHVVSCPTVFN